MQHSLANACEVKWPWFELTDQPDHRELRIEIVTPEAHLREDCKKGAHDNVELLASQLIKRQPLAEESIWREAAGCAFIHLARVQVSSPGVPGDEQVGYDHIETVIVGREIATTVVNHKVDIRSLQ